MLGGFDFHNPKGKCPCIQLHDLNDEIGNVTFRIIRKATLYANCACPRLSILVLRPILYDTIILADIPLTYNAHAEELVL
jgi:hypothetical protein